MKKKIIDRSTKVVRKRLNRLGNLQITMNGIFWFFWYTSSIFFWQKDGFFNKAMKDIWTNERLLNVVEQLIGPNIAGNCVYNIRSKLPNHEPTVVPWHQGNHANYAWNPHTQNNLLIPHIFLGFMVKYFK